MPAWFVLQTADGTERSFALQNCRTVIGRDARCDLRVPIPSVHGRHCEIRSVDDGWAIESLNPNSPVLVNGQPTTSSRLCAGDRVSIGPADFILKVQPGGASDLSILTETKPQDPALIELGRRASAAKSHDQR